MPTPRNPAAHGVPELPEVETVRRGLARHLPGRVIVAAEVRHPRAVRRHLGPSSSFGDALVGRRVGAAARRGKYLWLTLHDGDGDGGDESNAGRSALEYQPDAALVAHLGMSGQLLIQRPGTVPRDTDPHLRVVLRLDDGSHLWFVDQRTFGHLMVTDLTRTLDGGPGGHAPEVPGGAAPLIPQPVAHIARDLLDPHLDVAALVSATRSRSTEIKRALLDQSLVSGIGNIYADESLWRARLHGSRLTDTLAPGRLRELYDASADVQREALEVGGTSFDALYVDVDGASGWFARTLDAYGRAGQPCRRCGRALRREHFMNRSSFSCPSCQRRASVRASAAAGGRYSGTSDTPRSLAGRLRR